MARMWDYEPDLRGTNSLMNSRWMESVIKDRLRVGRAYAEMISEEFRVSGEYAGSFRTRVVKHGGPKSDRTEGTLFNIAPYSVAVEKRHKVMRKAGRRMERGI